MTDGPSYSRRSILGLTGGLVGVAAIGGLGLSQTSTTQATSQAPSIEWANTYEMEGEESGRYEIETVVQTSDGGFGLPGAGAPRTQSGLQSRRFSAVKAANDGEQIWQTFADPDVDSEDHRTTDGVATSDGGIAAVGDSDRYEGYGEDQDRKQLAHAAKFTADGEVAWTRTFDPQQDEEADEYTTGHWAAFEDAVATDDGGFVAAGLFENPDRSGSSQGWLVKLAADGSVVWDRKPETPAFDEVDTYGDGYVAFRRGDTAYTADVFDAAGDLERTVSFGDLGTQKATFIATDDDEFAYTADKAPATDAEQNIVLGKFDASGERVWLREYDGPAGGDDAGLDLVQTEDAGFAIGGYMSEAYTTDPIGAVLTTDSEGAEQWRKLLEDYGAPSELIQTEDGGYAGLVTSNTVVKLAATEDETATATDTTTTTNTATDTGTSTETSGDGTTDEDTPTETDTATPTDTVTESYTGDNGTKDEDDCVI